MVKSRKPVSALESREQKQTFQTASALTQVCPTTPGLRAASRGWKAKEFNDQINFGNAGLNSYKRYVLPSIRWYVKTLYCILPMKPVFLETYHGTNDVSKKHLLGGTALLNTVVLDQSRCCFVNCHFFGQVIASWRPHEQDT